MKNALEHGEFVVGKSQQTILFSGRGPWNDETLLRGEQELGTNIKQLDLTQPWGGLSCLFGESLMPPATFSSFIKLSQYRKTMGMTALAVVILDSEISNTIQNQLSKAYQTSELDFVFLTNIQQAITWLIEKDIKLDQQGVQQFFQQHLFVRPTEK